MAAVGQAGRGSEFVPIRRFYSAVLLPLAWSATSPCQGALGFLKPRLPPFGNQPSRGLWRRRYHCDSATALEL